MYPTDYNGPILDWPLYKRVNESPEEIAEIRANYAALTTMCDEYFGKILDFFDENNMWHDTCLILTTDHGFLLGEHDWWSKNRMPVFDEISRIPLMVYHPEFADQSGTRRKSLTQSIDIMPTIMELHDQNNSRRCFRQIFIASFGERQSCAIYRDVWIFWRRM